MTPVRLRWYIELSPRELWSFPRIAQAVKVILPEKKIETFAKSNGGVDLRNLNKWVIGSYPDTLLFLAEGRFQKESLIQTFHERARIIEGEVHEPSLTRVWGVVGAQRRQMVLFEERVVGLEIGHLSTLRVAEFFAKNAFQRTVSLFRAEPWAAVADRLGAAPFRAVAVGPFESAWAKGFAGLLETSTAVAAVAAPVSGDRLEVRLFVFTKMEKKDERMRAWFALLARTDMGRLLGLNRLPQPSEVEEESDCVQLRFELDPVLLAEGLHAATGAEIGEILRLSP